MKFYLSGKFEDKDLVRELFQKVAALGHEISYNWTTHPDYEPYEEHVAEAQKYSQNELNGIADCDVFIYLSHERGTTLPMEYGAALMSRKLTGKPEIYVVGVHNTRSPWFFNSLVKRVDTPEQALADWS